jgi:cell division septum initiation protein DivIVA
MPERHRDPPGEGAGAPRPAFDVVAAGYDPGQVDGYVQTLWRYCADLTTRVAAAEAAIRHERDRLAAQAPGVSQDGRVGETIGKMLGLAQQMSDEMVAGARLAAEQTLYELVREAGASHPIVVEAREHAAGLLAEATEEARRRAEARHADLEAEIARTAATLDALRRQQGELVGAVLRLRALVTSDTFFEATRDVAAAGRDLEPPMAAATNGAASNGRHAHTNAAGAPPGPRPDGPSVPPTAAAFSTSAATPDGTPRRGAPQPRLAPPSDVLDGELYPDSGVGHTPPTGPLRRDADVIDVEVLDDRDHRA